MEWKDDLHLPQVLGPTDIIPLMNWIFHQSFDTLAGNLKATAEQGLLPFNTILLDHPSRVNDSVAPVSNTAAATSDVLDTVNATGTTATLNISKGTAGAVFDRLISAEAKSAAGKKVADYRLAEAKGGHSWTEREGGKEAISGSPCEQRGSLVARRSIY